MIANISKIYDLVVELEQATERTIGNKKIESVTDDERLIYDNATRLRIELEKLINEEIKQQ